jgi:hypothetical protein
VAQADRMSVSTISIADNDRLQQQHIQRELGWFGTIGKFSAAQVMRQPLGSREEIIIMNHEELLIKKFVHPDRQERFLALLANPKGRKKLLAMLAHGVKLDSRFAKKIPANQHSVAEIEKELKSKGAPSNCYIISEDSGLDQKEMQLFEALNSVVGQGMGTFISCIPGRLVYFESEDIGERYILSAAA